jgi:hypothetical protein
VILDQVEEELQPGESIDVEIVAATEHDLIGVPATLNNKSNDAD